MASGKHEQWALMALGLVLIVLAIVFQGATGAGLGVVGALTLIFGIVRTSLEGSVKIGPGGLEATFAKEVRAEIEKQAKTEDIPPRNVRFVTDVLDAAQQSVAGPHGRLGPAEAARQVLDVARRSRPYECGACGHLTIFPDTGLALPREQCANCGKTAWRPLTTLGPPG